MKKISKKIVAGLVSLGIIAAVITGGSTTVKQERAVEAFTKETSENMVKGYSLEELGIRKEDEKEVLSLVEKYDHTIIGDEGPILAIDGPPMGGGNPVEPYTIKDGDTLWAIAEERYGNPDRWVDIWEENRDLFIYDDQRNAVAPGRWIHPGQEIFIPVQ